MVNFKKIRKELGSYIGPFDEQFEVRKDFGVAEPKLYEERQDDLAVFVRDAKAKGQEGKFFGERVVRRLWAGTFVNNSTEDQTECLNLLRGQVELGMRVGAEKYLNAAVGDGWTFFEPWFGVDKELRSKKDSPFLRFEKGEVVVVSNMAGSMPATPLVLESLHVLERDAAAYVLVGNSKSGETRFEDGKSMRELLFIHPKELKTLWENRQRIALVVDDSEITGITYQRVREGLERIGFEKDRMFKIATHDGNLLDGKGKSLNGRGNLGEHGGFLGEGAWGFGWDGWQE